MDTPIRHYVPAYAKAGAFDPDTQRSICGAFVNPHTEHAAEPSCPSCAELIAQEDSSARKDVS